MGIAYALFGYLEADVKLQSNAEQVQTDAANALCFGEISCRTMVLLLFLHPTWHILS